MKAIRVSETGGHEVLDYLDIDIPKPAAGEALVRIEAIGVNFIDVYHRTGLYKMPLPFTPGSEAAGVVEDVGINVDLVKKGDRVAFAGVRGAYAEFAAIPADKLVPLPDAIDAKTAAAAMLQGLTAHYLATSVHPIAAGETVLVHAAAGGVGALLVQLAKMRGARVFGTASAKHLHIAREAGCDVVIDYTKDDFESIVMAETDGKGCDAVWPRPEAAGRRTPRGRRCGTRRGGSPGESASASSTTRSVRRRSTRAWNAAACAGCSLSSANPAGSCLRSSPAAWLRMVFS